MLRVRSPGGKGGDNRCLWMVPSHHLYNRPVKFCICACFYGWAVLVYLNFHFLADIRSQFCDEALLRLPRGETSVDPRCRFTGDDIDFRAGTQHGYCGGIAQKCPQLCLEICV